MAVATNVGSVRQINEDTVKSGDSLVVVADGMGGHAAGEVASQMTADTISALFTEDPTLDGLEKAFAEANRQVLADAHENPERRGMGTTAIALGLVQHDDTTVPVIVHVGDSRAYQLRDGAIRQLTDDHSVAEEWVRQGRLTPEEAALHPQRHQLTRCVGIEDPMVVDVISVDAQPGDRILLCSDGLSNEVTDTELAEIAGGDTDLSSVVNTLVEAANAHGGRDNITVALIEFDDVTVMSPPVRRTSGESPQPQPVRSARPTPTRSRRTRTWWNSWRIWASVGALVATLVAAVLVLHWYTYSSVYIGNDQGVVALYQGQPGGVLWFEPVVLTPTDVSMSALRPADQARVNATISVPSAAAGLHLIDYMRSQGAASSLNGSQS